MRSLLVCVAILAALPTARALACSAAPCFDTFLFPASGSVPANMIQLMFMPGGSLPDRGADVIAPRLYRLEGESKLSIPFTSSTSTVGRTFITPVQAQPAGARLIVEADPGGCSNEPFHAELSIGEAAPLPTTLGTLAAQTKRDVLRVAVINGSCDGLVDAAYADLSVQLSESAAPYAGLFVYQLFVDDTSHGGFSSSLVGGERLAQGQARVFTVCNKESWLSLPGTDVPAGVHRVRMKAQLPDGSALDTDEIEVDLRCDGAPPAWPADAGPPVVRDAAVSTSGSDAAVTVDGGTPNAGDGERDDCSLASGRSASSSLLIVLALLWRRRRSSRVQR
jgi:hypothetical protein